MMQFLLQYHPDETNEPCGLCGQPTSIPSGTRLVVAGTAAPLCNDCGRKHAPTLAALVDLASAATRIGRIGRHSVFPPLTALLDLASAAEKYAQVSLPRAS